MKRPVWLFAAAVLAALLQIGFLAWMINARAAILRDGREVLLKVQPVDPRDLLRGDYVRLGYNISALPKTLLETGPDDAELARDATVWLRVRRGEDGIFAPVSLRLRAEAPALANDEADIRGRVRSGWQEITGTILVDYGIERFYLPEGEGRAIEADMGERSFFMIVAVGDGGQAQIKAFLDGDQRLYEEPLY